MNPKPRQALLKRRSILAGGTLLPLLAGCGMFDSAVKPPLTGNRKDILSTGAGLTVDPDEHAAITIPAVSAEREWQQPGRIPSHVGFNAAIDGLNPLWSTSIGAGISEPDILSYIALGDNGRGVLGATPIISNGRIYVVDAQGNVSAINLATRETIWNFTPKLPKLQSSNVGGGLCIDGDTLYIVDGVAETLAVDAHTNDIKWRVNVGVPGRSAPTVLGNTLYFSTLDQKLYALDIDTGTQKWNYAATPADTVIFGQPAPAIENSTLLAGFVSGDLVALRAETGEVIWSDVLGNANGRSSVLDFASIRGMPVIMDGTVYTVSIADVLVAIDIRSGRRLWEREVSGQNTLLVIGEWIFMISLDQQLACLDRITGRVRWVTQLQRFRDEEEQSDAVFWMGPLLLNDKLVCISNFPDNGLIVADPATGKIQMEKQLSFVPAVPAVVGEGKLFMISQSGDLHVFGASES
ncbi:PQQ-like beta-propeller repeat protein [Entomobacter blattae]|uniref:Outer membrane protein assembly factor BamB n=1 Tax=Entomobacter blattae TaxID=2762277 RepID=A0A7H1NSS1_9PROT|nr:PQQ-like beta-propeller repeat protein [Entomobacter blattae]QNT78831.1 Outer membrane protein assembly factor BamB [Entomobacter blattae]